MRFRRFIKEDHLVYDPKTRTYKWEKPTPERDVKALFEQMKTLIRLVIKGMTPALLIYGGPGIGKAQPVDALIKVPGGWKKMGDIQTGDQIISASGDVTFVDGIFPQGYQDVYEFTFSDGRKTQATLDHLWKVYGGNHRHRRYDYFRILTTEQILKLNFKTNPIFVSLIQHEKKLDVELPIEPYIMGILLGDGSFRNDCAVISSRDEEIKNRISELLPEGYSITPNALEIKISRTPSHNNRYLAAIKEFGLRGNYSYEKFIPEVYKEASLEQKLELIRGLMDSDGYVMKGGHMSLTTTSERLKDDFVYLIRSVGGMAFVKEKITSFTHNGEKKKGRKSYTIRIRYREPRELVSLSRKKERISPSWQYKDNMLRIMNIEKMDIQKECQCISISDPEHLYVTDNFVVTHNTKVTTETIHESGLVKDKDWFLVKGKVTPVGLYQTLYVHREKGTLIVFDDADGSFEDEDASIILKAALDSYDQRTINWNSTRTRDVSKLSPQERADYEKKVDEDLKNGVKNVIFPRQFVYEGSVIFISNLTADDVDSAVLSRIYKIDMTLTQPEIYQHIQNLLPKLEPQIPMETKERVWTYLKTNNRPVNVRNFVSAIKLADSGIQDWWNYVKYT